jgi:predicted acylesterase/phospholipase RssA
MSDVNLNPAAVENIEPVRTLPTDQPLSQPSPGMALCLSGGGYRAMLFHLGTLWRLNELGLMKGLKRVSSVSGGSITAGVLGLAWKNLNFNRSKLPSQRTDSRRSPDLWHCVLCSTANVPVLARTIPVNFAVRPETLTAGEGPVIALSD